MTKGNHNSHDVFSFSREEALKKFESFASNQLPFYSKRRNYDLGDPHKGVSKLSPYIRRRLISENEVLSIALTKNSLSSLEKFIQEIFWRTYWRGWLEMRPDVYWDYETGQDKTCLLYTSDAADE